MEYKDMEYKDPVFKDLNKCLISLLSLEEAINTLLNVNNNKNQRVLQYKDLISQQKTELLKMYDFYALEDIQSLRQAELRFTQISQLIQQDCNEILNNKENTKYAN